MTVFFFEEVVPCNLKTSVRHSTTTIMRTAVNRVYGAVCSPMDSNNDNGVVLCLCDKNPVRWHWITEFRVGRHLNKLIHEREIGANLSTGRHC